MRRLKVLVPFLEVMKMEGQRNSLLQVIEDPPPNEASMPKNSQRNFEKPQVTAYKDAPVILQVADRGNQKNQPFFITLLSCLYLVFVGIQVCVFSPPIDLSFITLGKANTLISLSL